jgi:hypothetical protein
MKVISALLPRFSEAAFEALPTLERFYRGNFTRVLSLAQTWHRRPLSVAQLGSLAAGAPGQPRPEDSAFTFRALHVRTLDATVDPTMSHYNGKANHVEANLNALIENADFCTFQSGPSGRKKGEGEVFLASDSMLLKKKLRVSLARDGHFTVSYFDSPGDRLRIGMNSLLSTTQLITFFEFFLLSQAKGGLVSMSFFDRSLLFGDFAAGYRASDLVKFGVGVDKEGSLNAQASSTFAKSATFLGGPDSTAKFYACLTPGRGHPPVIMAQAIEGPNTHKVGEGKCSSECDGRITVYNP